jgi:hypothetical protein
MDRIEGNSNAKFAKKRRGEERKGKFGSGFSPWIPAYSDFEALRTLCGKTCLFG